MDILPSKNAAYSTQEYWQERYTADQGSYDWCKTWKELRESVMPLLPDKNVRILQLGCGNSTLSQDMYDEGYHNIVSVDYSSKVIETMQALNAHRPGLVWQTADIRALPFEDQSFDVAFDKATLDSMLTEKHDPWNPPTEILKDCNAEVDEVTRVLKPTGIFIYLSFAQPHFRRKILSRPGWTLSVSELGDQFAYYLYVLRRDPATLAEPNRTS